MKRKRPSNDAPNKSPPTTKKAQILCPEYREVKLKDMPSSDNSPENTDDETYMRMHSPKEKIETMMRSRPDLRKVKANGRSTN